MKPDSMGRHSFQFPVDLPFRSLENVRLLPRKEAIVFSAYHAEDNQCLLCIMDSQGKLLNQFKIGCSVDFLVNDKSQVLTLAPEENARGIDTPASTVAQAEPYMLINLDSGAVRRFGLSGETVCFSKDLKRVLCLRSRINDGRCYKSLVLVELPSLEEKTILTENDLPAELVKSQVNLTPDPNLTPNHLEYVVNSAFDSMLWVKPRIEGDKFHYAIANVDLDTGEKKVVVPESTMPSIPVVGEGKFDSTQVVKQFTADGAGFTYMIAPCMYLHDIKTGKTTLLANLGILHNVPIAQESSWRYDADYLILLSPSGRQILRFENVRQEPPNYNQLRFAALDVFQSGKPVRLYTGQHFIRGALWLDDERIVFFEDDKIFVVNTGGGPPRQIFPPQGIADSN